MRWLTLLVAALIHLAAGAFVGREVYGATNRSPSRGAIVGALGTVVTPVMVFLPLLYLIMLLRSKAPVMRSRHSFRNVHIMVLGIFLFILSFAVNSVTDVEYSWRARSEYWQYEQARSSVVGAMFIQAIGLMILGVVHSLVRGTPTRQARREMGRALKRGELEDLRRLGSLHDGSLRGVNLQCVDMRAADLAKADLWDSNLHKSDLEGANLQVADLWGADLCEANLRRASLIGARLREVDLKGADLSYACLHNADLVDANLENSLLEETEWDNDSLLPDGTNWAPSTDMARFTDPHHPDFWRADNPDSPACRR